MAGYEEHLAQDARLAILKELAQQGDYRLSEVGIMLVLDALGYRRSREWMREQIGKLEDLGAVIIHRNGDAHVPQLVRAGRDHVEGRAFIQGIARPDVID